MKLRLLYFCAFLAVCRANDEESCPAHRFREKISPGKAMCCNRLIRHVVETGMQNMELFGDSRPKKALSVIVKLLQHFVQRHFGTSFEIIMSSKDFQLNTHYNGTKMCKFESNDHILAVYETPVKYDINSVREKFFANFALDDSPKLKMFPRLSRLHEIGLLRNHGVLGGGLLG